MKRPDDLEIKLHHDECHYDDENGFSYAQTCVGSSLWKLGVMWNMSYEDVVAKIAFDALMKEEDEYIIDGKYIPPHARGSNAWPHQSELPEGEVVYH